MPYGMERNEKWEWFVFNREYKPLGWNTWEHIEKGEMPIFVKYEGLGEATLLKLACNIESSVRRDENGEIYQIWFYNDATNPKDDHRHWPAYFERIKKLSKLKVHKDSMEAARDKLPDTLVLKKRIHSSS